MHCNQHQNISKTRSKYYKYGNKSKLASLYCTNLGTWFTQVAPNEYLPVPFISWTS